MSSVADNVDICVTVVSDKPPSFPLREELLSLGVEVVYNARGTGERAIKHETHKAIKEFREHEKKREQKKLRLFPPSKQKLLEKEEKRKQVEQYIKDHPHVLSYGDYKRRLYHVDSTDTSSLSSWSAHKSGKDASEQGKESSIKGKSKKKRSRRKRRKELGSISEAGSSEQAAMEALGAFSGAEIHTLQGRRDPDADVNAAYAANTALAVFSYTDVPLPHNGGHQLDSLAMSSSEADSDEESSSSDTVPMTETTFGCPPTDAGSIEIALISPSDSRWHYDAKDSPCAEEESVVSYEVPRSPSSSEAVMPLYKRDSVTFAPETRPEVRSPDWSLDAVVSQDHTKTPFTNTTSNAANAMVITGAAIAGAAAVTAMAAASSPSRAKEGDSKGGRVNAIENASIDSKDSIFGDTESLDELSMDVEQSCSQETDIFDFSTPQAANDSFDDIDFKESNNPADEKEMEHMVYSIPSYEQYRELQAQGSQDAVFLDSFMSEKEAEGGFSISSTNGDKNETFALWMGPNEEDAYAQDNSAFDAVEKTVHTQDISAFDAVEIKSSSDDSHVSDDDFFESLRSETPDPTFVQRYQATLEDEGLVYSDIVAHLERSPKLASSPSSADGRLVLHLACDREFPSRRLYGDTDQRHLVESLLEDVYERQELIEAIVESHPGACLYSDNHGDLPVHLLARRLLEWEAEWRQQLRPFSNNIGTEPLTLRQLHKAMSQTIDILLKPVATVLSLCRSPGRIGRLLPLHIATAFAVRLDTLKLILKTYPEAAAVPCDVLGTRSCIIKGELPLLLLERARFFRCKPLSVLEQSMEDASSHARSNPSAIDRFTLADDLSKHSDIVFAYHPGVLPFRRERTRIQRLECLIRDDVKRVAEGGGEEEFATAVRIAWTWLCTFNDGLGPQDNYVSSISHIVNSLHLDAVRTLAAMRNRKGELVLQIALPQYADIIKKRLNSSSADVFSPEDSFKTNVFSGRSSESIGENAPSLRSLGRSGTDSSASSDEGESRDESSTRSLSRDNSRPPMPSRASRANNKLPPSYASDADQSSLGSSIGTSDSSPREYYRLSLEKAEPLKTALLAQDSQLKEVRTSLSALTLEEKRIEEIESTTLDKITNDISAYDATAIREDVSMDSSQSSVFQNDQDSTRKLLDRVCILEERLLRREIDLEQLKLATHEYELRVVATLVDQTLDDLGEDPADNVECKNPEYQSGDDNDDTPRDRIEIVVGDDYASIEIMSAMSNQYDLEEQSQNPSDESSVSTFGCIRKEIQMTQERHASPLPKSTDRKASGIINFRNEHRIESGMSREASGVLLFRKDHLINYDEKMSRKASGILSFRKEHLLTEEEATARAPSGIFSFRGEHLLDDATKQENTRAPASRRDSEILRFRKDYLISEEEELKARAKQVSKEAVEFWRSMQKSRPPRPLVS